MRVGPEGARWRRPLLAALLLLSGGGCGEEADRPSLETAAGANSMLVFAASDLQAALAEIAASYESESGTEVTLVFGSTGNLATQIENGAPADLFFAANQSFLDRLGAAGLLADDTRRLYARGRLALVWRADAPPLAALADLAKPAYATIAIANPEHAPYGMAAREALQKAGLWESVSQRLVLAENIAQALQFVTTGNADAGLVALSLVSGGGSGHLIVADSLHAPLDQAAAVMRRSARPEAARAFLDRVSSPSGQAVLGRYGFGPPAR